MAGTANPAALRARRASTGGLRLGLLRPYFLDILDDAVGTSFDGACAQLGKAGVAIAERAVPHAADTATVYLHLQLPEASAYHAPMVESHPDLYTPPVRLRLELGRYVMGEDYARAAMGARVLTGEVEAALEAVDALVLPTVPIVAPTLGATTLAISGATHPVRALMLRLTQLFDVTGHP